MERVERVVTVAGSSDSAGVAFLARDRVGFGASSFDDAAVRVFEVFFSVSSTASCFLALPRAAFFGGLSTISPDACRLRVVLLGVDSGFGTYKKFVYQFNASLITGPVHCTNSKYLPLPRPLLFFGYV